MYFGGSFGNGLNSISSKTAIFKKNNRMITKEIRLQQNYNFKKLGRQQGWLFL